MCNNNLGGISPPPPISGRCVSNGEGGRWERGEGRREMGDGRWVTGDERREKEMDG